MLRLALTDGGLEEVDASVVTIENGSLSCWQAGAGDPVARYDLERVLSIGIDDDGALARARKEHPNAYRRWTAAEETAVAEAFGRGEPIKDIAAATGRRVGGIRSRLIALGLLEPRPGDRVTFVATADRADESDQAAPQPGG